MTEEWVEVNLSEVFSLNNSKLGDHSVEPRVFSLSKYDGFVPADEYFDKRIASRDLAGYKVVAENEWAYSTIHIDEGSIARNTLGYEGVISPMYTTLTWASTDHSPAFFELLLKSPPLLVKYGSLAQGTVNRRRSLPFKTFADLTVTVPPLSVQRRIVDLLAHLDSHLANLQTERGAAIGLLERLALDQLNLPGENGIELQSLLVRNIGGVWGDDPGAGELTVDVFRSTEFSDLGYLDCAAEAQRSISSRQYESRYLSSGDILVEKSGGTPTRSVGRVVRVNNDDLSGPAIGANFLQLLRVDATLVEPDYLFWVLWASHRRGDGFAFQQASTNIRNLKTKEYLSRRITLPDVQEQRAIAALLDDCLTNVTSLEREIQGLAATRSSLLGAFLGGSRAIPAAYDSFLSGVV